ncbi:phosphatidylinositol dephosphorylation [Rhizoctonia solani]|uniref:Phosphatidylinositol dephosphorylation n=1 Tax=Rhizoctonia solani TaxID=456999 RepID=A0A8H7HDL0_9AGAM|nr:phosphatidylinositol dephosphorylation [Rhizoctonia solani]
MADMSRYTMDSNIEENSIKPVNKLRERFEALAASSTTKAGGSHSNDHEEGLPTGGDTMPNASPRRNGLANLRPSSIVSSPGRNSSVMLKKDTESDASNDIDEAPTPTQIRASPPPISRKPGLKPPPPPPPERTSTLKSKSSTDSVVSSKGLTPIGVHRKPPPPPPLHSQHGHMASLSVGDLTSHLSATSTPSFRSLDTSPISTPGVLLPLDSQIRRSPSPIPREGTPSLAPTSTNGQTPPILPIRINIPDTSQVEPFHNDSEVGDTLRSPVKRLGPPRAQVLFTPSTPGSPAPPLPSRTSPDSMSSSNTTVHHTLPRRTDTLNQQAEVDEFGLGLRSPPPRHHSLNSGRSASVPMGRPAPPPPPPPRPSSVLSPASAISPQTGITNSLVDAPPPLPNRRSNPNLRSEVIPIVPSPVSTASTAPPPPMATRPTSSTWGRLAGLKAWATSEIHDHGSFKPPPPPTRIIAPGDKLPPPRRVSGDDSSDSEDDVTTGPLSSNPAARKLQDDMPDSSQSRRCPPIYRSFTPIHVPSHGAVVAAAGYRICIAHTSIEIYDAQRMPSPQFIIDLEYIGIEWRSKEPRITAMEFRPGETREEDGRYIWCGGKDGHLFELDVWSGHVTDVLIPSGGHSQAVIHVLRYGNSMLTMDESGKIIVFEPSEDRLAPALSRFTRSHRAAEKQTFAKILGGHLWTSGANSGGNTTSTRGTPFRTYDLLATNFTTKHLFPSEPVGPALCGAIIPESPDRVYIGHEGGCISIWKYDILTSQHTCVQVVKLSASSVITMEGVGSRLWLGTRSGTITVCEVREDSPWMVTNQWQAHGDSPVAHIAVDPYSISKVGKLVVYSVGRDDRMLFWDGLVGDNWIDDEMQKREEEYSTYRDVKVLICTWNIDSAKPDLLTGNRDNTSFLDNVLGSVDRPDIIVFGFQEVIDLENKKLTAKTVLLGSQKSKTEKISEKVSRSYKLWYDRLVLAVRLAMPPDDPYTVIHSENLVGLFTCIFVRNSERISLTDTAITTIKRGMKGRYGNKGAIIARFTLDDTSFCFLNCHLAAGQKHVRERNQDLAAMFEEKTVFPYASPNVSATAYVGGGDGTMVLDHEVVFLNGDLNYRIDQRRELVIQSIHAGDINSLLPNDQLLKEMQYNPGFRLRHFTEPPITFAPTYKYDRGSNEFDSSEKRRIPAWCDRILYRSRGDRVQYEHYKRYEPNVSDHRPVSGGFRVKVKSVNRDAWNDVKARVEEEWQGRQDQLLWASQEFYTGNMSKLLL